MTYVVENGEYNVIGEFLKRNGCKKFLLVCSKSFDKLAIKEYLYSLEVPFVRFGDFSPNPKFFEVVSGVKVFNDNDCDTIIAVGGGSAIDVAKCIKLFSNGCDNESLTTTEYKDTKVPFIAIPTTAGTGSEATHFAVVYKDGVKYSVAHESLIPSLAVLDYTILQTLSDYQKKSTLLDALAQAIESFWSVNSTEESREYSKQAIRLIVRSARKYVLENGLEQAKDVMIGANLAGKAINISKTTAAHAMSYKLTSLYGSAHGHAVAMCLPLVWEHIIENADDCVDARGKSYLIGILDEIATAMGEKNAVNGVKAFNQLVADFNLENPVIKPEDLETLSSSVNVERLKNNPVAMTTEDIYRLYTKLTK